MKKSIITLVMIASLSLVSALAFAADCDPATIRPVMMEKITKLQQTPEKFAKIDAPLHEALARIPALQEKQDLDGICKELSGIMTMLESAEK